MCVQLCAMCGGAWAKARCQRQVGSYTTEDVSGGIQNLLICVEMFVAALAHRCALEIAHDVPPLHHAPLTACRYAFHYREFMGGRAMRTSLLKDNLALGTFAMLGALAAEAHRLRQTTPRATSTKSYPAPLCSPRGSGPRWTAAEAPNRAWRSGRRRSRDAASRSSCACSSRWTRTQRRKGGVCSIQC